MQPLSTVAATGAACREGEEPQPNCEATATLLRSEPAATLKFGSRPQGKLAGEHFDLSGKPRSVHAAPETIATSISFADSAWNDGRERSVTSTDCAILYYYIK
jgi:hypothetical protein